MEKIKKVLLVEDDQVFYNAIAEGFEDTELELLWAADGEEGLEKIKKEKPDFVLLDIMLPKMDGVEIAEKIKENGINVPIIFLTNIKDEERVSDALSVSGGNADYIVKTDVKIEDIVSRVRERLNLK